MNDEFKDFDLTPTLSFDVVPDENINLVKEKKEEPPKEEEIQLSEEEKKMVEAFVDKIDLTKYRIAKIIFICRWTKKIGIKISNLSD